VTIRRIPVDRRHDAKVNYPALSRLLDGRFRRFRGAMVELVSQVFTNYRDRCRRLQLQALIYRQRKH
jgi:hypothetical protein